MLDKLGRFWSVRQAYGAMAQRLAGAGFNGEGHLDLPACRGTLFPDMSSELLLEQLRTDAIAPGLMLPPAVLQRLLNHAASCSFTACSAGEPRRPVRLVSGSVRGCPEIMALLDDGLLADVATRYLGYRPRRAEVYLERLLAFPNGDEPPSYAPYHYHFDVPGLASVAVFFFLTDVDETSGAHLMLRRSHRDKPWDLLLRPGSRTGDGAALRYDPSLEYRVTGSAGSGFFEDLYAFHKVLCPRSADRLSLQIRYS